jgi:hypothetical protein
MKRHIFDIDVLTENGTMKWLKAPPFTHVRIGGVVLTRKQAIELWRLDFEERERRLDEMRRRTAV